MKDNYIMFDAVARVDDQLIDRCANRMLQKATADDNAERKVKKKMRFSMKKVIPFAACAIIAIIIGTVLFMDPLSVFNHVSNAPNKEYFSETLCLIIYNILNPIGKYSSTLNTTPIQL